MRILVQRVTQGSVTIDGQRVAEIGAGLVILAGVGKGDTHEQADWLAEMLSQTSFAESRKVHEFTTSIFLYRDKLGGASIQRLSDALLFALPKLKDEVDLVSTMEFLVKVPTPAFALDILKRLSTFSSDQLLKPFVWDAMRMYSNRQDISPTQLATVRALAGSKGTG